MEVLPLCANSNFINITITIIHDGNTSFQTYQKPHNLYFYLPAHSVHPPDTLYGLIFITLRINWVINTRKEKYKIIMTKFFLFITTRVYGIKTPRRSLICHKKLDI